MSISIYTYCQRSVVRRNRNYLPFGPVSQSQNELQEDTAKIKILQYCVDDRCDFVAKRKGPIMICWTCSSDKIHDDTSREPK